MFYLYLERQLTMVFLQFPRPQPETTRTDNGARIFHYQRVVRAEESSRQKEYSADDVTCEKLEQMAYLPL